MYSACIERQELKSLITGVCALSDKEPGVLHPEYIDLYRDGDDLVFHSCGGQALAFIHHHPVDYISGPETPRLALRAKELLAAVRANKGPARELVHLRPAIEGLYVGEHLVPHDLTKLKPDTKNLVPLYSDFRPTDYTCLGQDITSRCLNTLKCTGATAFVLRPTAIDPVLSMVHVMSASGESTQVQILLMPIVKPQPPYKWPEWAY